MLTQPCDILNGVGPTLTEKLRQCKINTLQDLLFHLPYRYQDRTRITPIHDLRMNDWCVVMGRIVKTEVSFGKRQMLSCYLEDKTGILKLRFFHFNKQQVKQLESSPLIRVFGEIRVFQNTPEMIHPEYQLLEEDKPCLVEETLTPIYSSTQGLTQTRLRQLVKQTLLQTAPALQTLEWMSREELNTHGFQSMHEALEHLHNPPPDISMQSIEEGTHPGLKRLAFDELLAKRLSLQFARAERRSLNAPAFEPHHDIIHHFIRTLPFELTNAQVRVHQEIHDDLTQTKPMLRLVQGDVGSGKTVIAALAALQAIKAGYQVALMAPTDLLSEQLTTTLSAWLTPLDISVHRLSGKMTTSLRKSTLAAVGNHTCQLLVGTHALFQDAVTFARLGLVIIDEQHRFGVEQRLLLQQKGESDHYVPHQLLMTATPIPRTLAMTEFSHLDLSIIDELPKGRTPITTAVLHQGKREHIIERLHHAIQEGRQAYWVCTLIDESEKLQCMAATESAAALQSQLPNVRIGLVHGRMKNTEKEEIMARFKQGELDLLVATTVIEVGVDVPNASLMIIENAERLGLSQLHQLRGRVGRGNIQSHCLLLYQSPLSATATERLKLMRETTDGFLIAEKDLELRGAGEVLGTRQTGYRTYKIADFPRDKGLLPLLPGIAKNLMEQNKPLAHHIAKRWLGEFELFLQG